MRKKQVSTIRLDVQELLTCKCGDPSHQCIIGYDKDDDVREVFLSVHLVPEANIFKRVANAFRYLFGRRSIYGDFDEIILSPLDVPKLRKVVEHLENQTSK